MFLGEQGGDPSKMLFISTCAPFLNFVDWHLSLSLYGCFRALERKFQQARILEGKQQQIGSITLNESINFPAAVALDLWFLLASEFRLDFSRHTYIFLLHTGNFKLLPINCIELLDEWTYLMRFHLLYCFRDIRMHCKYTWCIYSYNPFFIEPGFCELWRSLIWFWFWLKMVV